MENTNRILQTICTEAIRHIIANITIDDALRKKNEIAEQLKSQLEHIHKSWGIVFDQVGIERITILSSEVFNDLQQKNRDELRFAAAISQMETDQLIEQKKAEYLRETEKTHTQSERESRILKSTTETEIRSIELNQQSQRELEELQFAEQKLLREKQTEKAKLKVETDEKVFLTEEQLRFAKAKTQAEISELEQNQQSLLARQQLEEQLLLDKQVLEQKRLAEKQQAKLKLKTEKQHYLLELLQQREKINHEIKLQSLEYEKLAEELKNNVSNARIQADFVRQLPEIAASIKIDHYSSFNTSGASPLAATIAQLLNIFEHSGIKQSLLTSKTENQEQDKAS